jgi:hypothetical protein
MAVAAMNRNRHAGAMESLKRGVERVHLVVAFTRSSSGARASRPSSWRDRARNVRAKASSSAPHPAVSIHRYRYKD